MVLAGKGIASMEGIPGVPAPIPHSKLPGPDKVRFAGSGDVGIASDPVNQPLVKLSTGSAVAAMTPIERTEYLRTVGPQATERMVATRSEERRVGAVCVRTGRDRGVPSHQNKKN